MENSLTLDPQEVSFDFGLPAATAEPIEPQVKPVENITEEVEPENLEYKDYTDFALSALHLKEKGFLEVDEIPKDLNLEGLVTKLEQSRQKESEEYRQLMLQEAREFRNLMDLRLNGVPQEVVDDIVATTGISKIKLDLEPGEESDQAIVDKVSKNRERIIVEELKYKGLEPSVIDLMVETFKDKGLIEEKSKASKSFFDNEEARIVAAIKEQKEAEDQEELRRQKIIQEDFQKIVSTKVVRGYTMTDDEVKDLTKFINEPSEVITYTDPKGKPISEKITPLIKKMNELQNDVEGQVAFALWLMKGTSFTPIKQQGQIEQHNSLFNAIKKRGTEKPKPELNNEEFLSDFIGGELYK